MASFRLLVDDYYAAYIAILILCHVAQTVQYSYAARQVRRTKPLEKYNFRPDAFASRNLSDQMTPRRWSIDNMTCDFVVQPLNHFLLPRDRSPLFRQRCCVYDGFLANTNNYNNLTSSRKENAPIFVYTGNESPLPEYINSTGLIWELAEAIGAQVVFVEHRYEGESLPPSDLDNCLSYSSSFQALADYATILEQPQFQRRPVIAFGGSYGGMLSAWLRMKYPNLVAGAIAASAPIFGFPKNFPDNIDAAWQVVTRGLDLAYPPTRKKPVDNYCVPNLLAAWPLIQILGEDPNTAGRKFLTDVFRLCDTLADPNDLIAWAQSPWFDLAEGSFPYPSGYIVYALTHDERAQLPSWPLQAACWKNSQLHKDLGIRFDGNLSDVRYKIRYGDSNLEIVIDWDQANASSSWNSNIAESRSISSLLASVRDAVSIWFNITKNVKCYNLTTAPNEKRMPPILSESFEKGMMHVTTAQRSLGTARVGTTKNGTEQCRDRIQMGSWPAMCCNEEMNLIITEARGLGRDVFWPPTHPRGTTNHADVIAVDGNVTDDFCHDPDGFFGFPRGPQDPWATWMDTIYGGTRIDAYSNIVFSNGMLDPWSAAGVYAPGTNLKDFHGNNAGYLSTEETLAVNPVPGLYVQNVSHGMLAVVMEYGGHHTDLMWSSPHDPPSIAEARRVEKNAILEWINEWRALQGNLAQQ